MSIRSEVAYHEAGHAVIAHVLDFQVRRVTIMSDDKGQGRMIWGKPPLRGDWCDLTPHRRQRVEDWIIVALAGPLAMRRRCGFSGRITASAHHGPPPQPNESSGRESQFAYTADNHPFFFNSIGQNPNPPYWPLCQLPPAADMTSFHSLRVGNAGGRPM
jgi:hypothetical protein